MGLLGSARREAIKGLLRTIMKAGIGATRAVEIYVIDGAADERELRMNKICAEVLFFHMWRACKRARKFMVEAEYRDFCDYAVNGLAVAAAGCFTGLYDKAAQAKFLKDIQNAFIKYERCGPDIMSAKDPLTSNTPLPTLARRIAELAGKIGDEQVTMAIIVVCMESMNASRVEEGVAWVKRSGEGFGAGRN